MRWDDLPRSDNIDDRRENDDSGGGGFGGPGGGFNFPVGRGGLGIGTIVVLGVIGWALGIDPSLLIGGAEILSGANQPQVQAPPTARRTSHKTRPAASSIACSAAPMSAGRKSSLRTAGPIARRSSSCTAGEPTRS